MIVVQWSMTERFIEMNTHSLLAKDETLTVEYKKVRNFQQRLNFWQRLIEVTLSEPARSSVNALIPRIQALGAQRDEVVHRMWGTGMEAASPSSGGRPTTDGGLMPRAGEKLQNKERGGPIPLSWHATFSCLRTMATEMAHLNRDLLAASFSLGATALSRGCS
jgi:hypothetical protein